MSFAGSSGMYCKSEMNCRFIFLFIAKDKLGLDFGTMAWYGTSSKELRVEKLLQLEIWYET